MVSSKLLKQFLAALVCYICSIGYYHETSSMQNLLVNIFIAEYVNSEFFVQASIKFLYLEILLKTLNYIIWNLSKIGIGEKLPGVLELGHRKDQGQNQQT